MKHVIQGFCINTKNVDADAVAKRLNEISQRDNGLTAESVLAEAQDPQSPLHEVFEWDDTEAAVQWRLHQARNLIRSIKVVTSEKEIVSPKTIFVKTETVYLPTVQVVQSETLYEQAFALLMQRVEQAERAAAELQSAADDASKKKKAGNIIAALQTVKVEAEKSLAI